MEKGLHQEGAETAKYQRGMEAAQVVGESAKLVRNAVCWEKPAMLLAVTLYPRNPDNRRDRFSQHPQREIQHPHRD